MSTNIEAVRNWLEEAERARTTCENQADFDCLIAGQAKRLARLEGSKPSPRKLVEVSIPTAELGRYVSQFNVGFGKLTIENNAERAVSVGSGTLVSIGSRKGILTACHVLTALPDHEEIALILSSEGPSIYRATKLLMSNARKLMVPGYAVGPDGPDLGFLHIPDVDAATLEALSGVFYNLSTRATEVLSNEPPSLDFMDVTVGIVHERTAVLPAGAKTQVTQFEAFFCAGKSIAQREGGDGYDLIDFEVTNRPDFILPSSFEGTSGGSLWRFYLAMKNGEPTVIEKRLMGVPFYQTHSQKGNRLLICQGPHSIYDKLAAEVAAVLGA